MATKEQTVLGTLLAEKQKQVGISTRKLGRSIGVAHTTIARILDGQAVDLDTIEKVADYLQVNVVDLLNVGNRDKTEALGAQVALLCEMEPRLVKVFREAMHGVNKDKIPPEALRDIIRYAAFRINMETDEKYSSVQYKTELP